MTHTWLVFDLPIALADVLDGRDGALELAGAMIAACDAVIPLEPLELELLGDLVAARCAAAVLITAWRASTLGAPKRASGAWRFLRQMQAAGFDRVSEQLRRVPPRLPYRPRPTTEPARARPGPPSGPRPARAQLRTPNTNTRYLHEAGVALAEQLLATAPDGLDRVLLLNSGSEANDLAWRIARFSTGRSGAIVTSSAFHGVTDATTALSPEEWPPSVVPEHVARVRPPASLTDDAPDDAADEVQAGYGRTGPTQSVLKIRPPLVFTANHAEHMAERLNEVLQHRS